ncbi:transcription repressor OFP2-like [Solanum pennellii]|uniref:Transcription repressor n=1 Tax=Solanum pennellii TaxID=28526 RepID=A0ABM1H0E9_SOLPN|nr:transcription repressor OFP2-like [Solanum pennellii]
MGNHKFKFSDMMPNTWFYKLKDMSKTKNHKSPFSSSSTNKSQYSQPRSSFSYTRRSIRVDKIYNSHSYNFLDQPRRSSSSSSKKKTKRKTIYKPSPKHIPSSVTNYVSVSNKLNTSSSVYSTEKDKFPELDFLNSPSSEFDSVDSQSFNELPSTWPNSCNCHFTSSATDIIIDMNDKALSNEFHNLNTEYVEFSDIDQLPPIITKASNSIKNIKQDENVKAQREKEPKNRVGSPVSTKHYSSSSGVKLRTNSTKVANKRNSVSSSKRRSKAKKESCSTSTGTSFAIVKASIDPEKDFRESMIEMVVENNIRASKELENLLACYLSLNSNEYHDLIVKAFEQIWFDLSDLHL